MDTTPKLYWYGQDGSVLAETDGSGNPVNEYIYFDGMRIARRDAGGNVYYSFGNELGSPELLIEIRTELNTTSVFRSEGGLIDYPA